MVRLAHSVKALDSAALVPRQTTRPPDLDRTTTLAVVCLVTTTTIQAPALETPIRTRRLAAPPTQVVEVSLAKINLVASSALDLPVNPARAAACSVAQTLIPEVSAQAIRAPDSVRLLQEAVSLGSRIRIRPRINQRSAVSGPIPMPAHPASLAAVQRTQAVDLANRPTTLAADCSDNRTKPPPLHQLSARRRHQAPLVVSSVTVAAPSDKIKTRTRRSRLAVFLAAADSARIIRTSRSPVVSLAIPRPIPQEEGYSDRTTKRNKQEDCSEMLVHKTRAVDCSDQNPLHLPLEVFLVTRLELPTLHLEEDSLETLARTTSSRIRAPAFSDNQISRRQAVYLEARPPTTIQAATCSATLERVITIPQRELGSSVAARPSSSHSNSSLWAAACLAPPVAHC